MKSVLIVCHANTARSVMAQALLERMLAHRLGLGRVRVRSAGVGPAARDGMIPSLDARLVLREEGIYLAEDAQASIDLRRHPELVAEADLILTMTVQQRLTVQMFDEGRGRAIYTLREFAGEEGDIGDPAAQGETAFRACRDEIKRYLLKSLDRFAGAKDAGAP
ncbi:MAG TPA: low molecular weight protein arginine phosphatase [Methylomirabilota bacterium]|nr:low molecular weight protein arginine phosphatase [Methylomirabilota bacterium]